MNSELRERELIKLASWASALAETLPRRGVDAGTANLAAEVGIAVFRTAFARWVATTRGPKLPELVRETLAELNALTAAGRSHASRSLAASSGG